MADVIVEEVCTITAKGQTTVPKSVRQALGVGYGGRIAFRVQAGTVTVHAIDADVPTDPALAPFLALLEADLAVRPAAVWTLAGHASQLDRLADEIGDVDPDAPIEGKVGLQLTLSIRPGATPDKAAMTQRHGWSLFAHPQFVDQLDRLIASVERARRADPAAWTSTTDARLLASIRALILDRIPRDPLAAEYRQGNTLGHAHRHWFRAKFGGNRFRLFYRADSRSRVIVQVWVNDRDTLRKAGSRTDPYAVFARMLAAGNPPDDWPALIDAARALDAPP